MAAQAMLHTNNGGATIEQPITKENLSTFRLPTRAKKPCTFITSHVA
jgi:hypothetical protein